VPRQNRRQPGEERPLTALAAQRTEEFAGVPHCVRTVRASERVYRCPGCDHEIVGVGHVVVWPFDDRDADHRRHWHNRCWDARHTRRPTRR
jgi:hypothetical protein